ncbi:Abhd17a [Symbiodinium microadriaticum]|nr:Abhd17a [Symbiodinium sp. KB8]CAE7236772.1 Abhd17a [Symbiodinium microadriaticum]
MGSAINAVAFPAPHLGKAFYQDELLRRRDLVFLKTDQDESIPACHVRAQRKHSFLSTPPVTILYSHGNAEDVGLHLDYIDALAEYTGADVFSYEYVGYSLSRLDGDTPSEAGCIRSIDAAWRYLVDEQKIHPRRIVIFGRSIGSGPSVDLASRAEVEGTEFSPLDAAGVILQSPLESGAYVVLGGTAATLGYYLDIFRNYEKIGNIKAKVAIMHGTDDEVVPFSNGEALHRKLQQPHAPLWLEGYGHNNMPQEDCFRYARDFIESLSLQ